MKIDRRQKKPTSELTEKAKKFIADASALRGLEFTKKLASVTTWEFGKSELCLWADILNIIDEILEAACIRQKPNSFALKCDLEGQTELKNQVLESLKFTALLFEYSFTRGVYQSMEHLTTLLESGDVAIVVAVLNVLYVSSKRTSYLGNLPSQQKDPLLHRLICIAESWGGKENGYSLSECCSETFLPPRSSTTLHFEFFDEEEVEQKNDQASSASRIRFVHVEKVHEMKKSPGEIMDDVLSAFRVPENKHIKLLMQVRLAKSFGNYMERLNCIKARLLSLSVLIYSNMLQENSTNILYSGFIEECVEALQLEDSLAILDIKTEILKTLTSIIYLDRNPRLNAIIEATGAAAYHGFLPTLVRTCIQNFIDGKPIVSQNYIIALFSLLYHMAGYDNGAEALVSSALTESLLRLVNWTDCHVDSIIYLTRSVRIIDLVTNVNTQAFQSLDGMHIFINRLSHEVDICRQEEPHQIEIARKQSSVSESTDNMAVDPAATPSSPGPSTSKLDGTVAMAQPKTSSAPALNVQCCPQRVVLIKSLLNFIKKAVSDPQFSENIRHIMEGPLPAALRHIISNPDYYGSMLFLRAIVVVTVFINQEPSQLTSLQDKGLTDVIMQALLIKEIPPSREVLGHLPQTFSALCLNERGLNAFMGCAPFEKLYKVLLSPKYLSAMRKRRSSDSLGDTAISLGSAIDEIMRHQPTLKPKAMEAVIKLLEELCTLGSDAKYTCASKSNGRTPSSALLADGVAQPNQQAGGASGETSDEDDDEDEDSRQPLDMNEDTGLRIINPSESAPDSSKTKTAIPLVEYVQNVMKFIEAILSNNSTDDHARLFLQLNGLPLLVNVLTLPNLPADFGVSSACHNVATVIRYLLSLTRELRVLTTLLTQLFDQCLKPISFLTNAALQKNNNNLHLLEDLYKNPLKSDEEVPNSPTFRALGCILSHLVVFNHINRLGTNQNDLKALILHAWCDKNSDVLSRLHELYRIMLWENTALLGVCSSEGQNLCFMDSTGTNMVPKFCTKPDADSSKPETSQQPMEVDVPSTSNAEKPKVPNALNEQLKPYVAMSSRLNRHLSELFVLLTRVSAGGTMRSRRGQSPYVLPPSPNGVAVVERLLGSLRSVFDWQPQIDGQKMKLWLTFLISLIGYLTQLLFDDRRQGFHLVLAKFYSLGNQHAYFRLFDQLVHVLQAQKLSLNDSHSEFLESWLSLIDKLVDPKCIVESVYQYFEPSGTAGFNANQYLAVTQRMAFQEVSNLWTKLTNVNVRVSELTLTLLVHIIKSDFVTQRETKTTKEPSSTERREEERFLADQVNPAHLQQLMDMGFAREIAIEALLNASTVEQAAEFCVSMPLRNPRSVSFGSVQFTIFDEEEQIQQAIALSLGGQGQDGQNPTEAGTTQQSAVVSESIGPSSSEKPQIRKPPTPLEEVKPLSCDELQRFFDHDLLGHCLKLIDASPDLVYRVADLLSVALKRCTDEWMTNLFNTLCQEVSTSTQCLQSESSDDKIATEDKAKQLTDSNPANLLSVRLHLLCLLFEEFKQTCATLLAKSKMLTQLISLLSEASNVLACSPPVNKQIRWLAPLMLCLDAYERESFTLSHRLAAEKLDKIVWKYWDNRNWANFTTAVNKQITDAFKNGSRAVKFTNNRRRYTVDFVSMTQTNNDSGYQRPVIFLPAPKETEIPNDQAVNGEKEKGGKSPDESSSKQELELVSLKSSDKSAMLKAVVNLIELPVDADTLHAALRLCLRLTRCYAYALEFLELGGVQKLLRLKQNQSFTGLPAIVSLLVRHIIEDDAVLRHTLERVIRYVVQGGVSTAESSANPEELYYVLRLLGPVACREPKMFTEVVKKVVRIKVPAPRKSDDDEAALLNPNIPVELRVEGGLSAYPSLGSASKEILSRLLNYLTQKQDTVTHIKENKNEAAVLATSTPEKTSQSADAPAAASSTISLPDETKDDQPLVQKSAVLKLIAELIRSYSAVASFIAEYRYTSASGDMVTEDCSALAFFFDNLLTDRQSPGNDSEQTQGVRAIVATLAAANHCEEAQSILVTEVKSALQRALTLNESQLKHNRVCSIVSLITLMKDMCPTIQITPAQAVKSGTPVQNAQSTPAPVRSNNIVKWLMKKKIIWDLARVPHSLDMSSPWFVTTVNAVLKPLEELTRIINAPNTILASNKQKAGNILRTSSNNQQSSQEQATPGAGGQPQIVQANVQNQENERRTELTLPSADTTTAADREPSDIRTATDIDRGQSRDTGRSNEPDMNQSGVVENRDAHESADFDANATVVLEQSAVSAASLSTDSESGHDEEDEEEDDGGGSTVTSSEVSHSADDDEDEDDEEMAASGQEAGNEHGSEQDDEASEYEDVDDEVINDNEDMEDEEASDFDENAEAMHIDLDETVNEANDPFGLLNTVLRDTLGGGTGSNREFGTVFVTTHGGNGLSIPDVDQFLAVGPEISVFSAQPLGVLGTTHPLLIRHSDSPSATVSVTAPSSSSALQSANSLSSSRAANSLSSSRTFRFQGQRNASGLLRQGAVRHHRTYRYIVNAPSNNNSSTVLQRLLGAGVAQELIQLSQSLPNPSATARLVISEDDLRDNGIYEDIENTNNRRLSVLTSVPNAYLRWVDESRILDGDGVHYVSFSLRQEIIEHLEACRNDEFEARRERRKQMALEEQKTSKEQEKPEEEDKEKVAQATNEEPAAVSVDQEMHPVPETAPSESVPQTEPSTDQPQPVSPNAVELEDARELSLEDARSPPASEENLSNAAIDNPAADTLSTEEQRLRDLENGQVSQVSAPVASVFDSVHDSESLETALSIPPSSENYVTAASITESSAVANNAAESDMPEGVDPAFLAALPENIRQEVIADQLRLQRLRRQNQQLSASRANQAENVEGATTAVVAEVSPEFLAALPPELQEEVLAQQRLAQQQQQPQTAAVDLPVDPVAFMETLPPSLRQQVLTDADDSQVALLPPHLAAEARRLRSQFEMQQAGRIAAMSRQFPFMNLLNRRRETGGFSSRYAIRSVPRRQYLNSDAVILSRDGRVPQKFASLSAARGQQLLDKEAVVCLLILFFVDDSRLNIGRLHKILKSLCYHGPTRDWIIRALLAILEKAAEIPSPMAHGQLSSSEVTSSRENNVSCGSKRFMQNWLNLTLSNSIAGSRVEVFEFQRPTSTIKKNLYGQQASNIHIHTQAKQNVCRHVMDTLIILAKSFPVAFFPSDLQERVETVAKMTAGPAPSTAAGALPSLSSSKLETLGEEENNIAQTPTQPSSAHPKSPYSKADFWEVLARLDSYHANAGRKSSKTISKTHQFSQFESCGYTDLTDSPFGCSLSMLSHPVVANNESLMDSLLRFLLLTVNFLPSVISDVKDLIKSWEARAETSNAQSLLLHLPDLVKIVTRSKFSDECLEQGRGFLLRTAQVFTSNTSIAIFYALVKAALELGNELCDQLKALLEEINCLHAEQEKEKDKDSGQTSASSSMKPGPSSSVQLPMAPKNQKAFVQNAANKELQLPAMTALTTKASIQQCFLRTLNTLIMLRENSNEQTEEKQVKESEANNAQTTTAESEGATQNKPDEPMETDQASAVKTQAEDLNSPLSRFLSLNNLWDFLGECLRRLTESNDPHIVLVLQPAVEAFFLVHASKKREKAKTDNRSATARVDVGERRDSGGGVSTADVFPASPPIVTDSLTASVYQTSASQDMPEDTKKFIKFAEEHRTVLNQILRQSNEHLADGPFAVLVDYTRILDFDVKRRYFRKELERSDDGFRREDVAVRIRRDHVFQDSFRELFRLRPHEWKSRFYIIFEGEEGQDAGGLLREWYSIITREIFNPDYALFQTAPGDRVTYMINPSSYVNVEHLDYFKFVGRLIAKAVYDNKLLDCFFTRAFYKHILSKQVKYNDLESEDPSFYQSLVFLLENPVDAIGHITFSLEVQEFGLYEIRDLKTNGRNINVTEENKKEYVRLVCQMKMTGAIRQQLNAFLTGFYDIIPRHLISIFNEQELELLISGLPNIDVDDLQANTEYNKYTKTSLQIQWFWRALRSFDQADRAKFLQFVTGTSKVPLQGFAALEGMHGIQKFQIHRDDRSTDRLPTAHTCFNQLDLPPYETYDKLKDLLLVAIRECTEGFGFA